MHEGRDAWNVGWVDGAELPHCLFRQFCLLGAEALLPFMKDERSVVRNMFKPRGSRPDAEFVLLAVAESESRFVEKSYGIES